MTIPFEFGRWKYTVDRRATVDAYGRAERGGADSCACVGCRNFSVARASVFPGPFLQLLDKLGIDPLKDAEVYHVARLNPDHHAYGGWYHFVGTLVETGDFPVVDFGNGFTVYMCRASAPRLESLEGFLVVQLEFRTENVPWLLNDPEPEGC